MLPLAYCRRTKQLQLVALDGSSGLNVGQVFYPTADYQYRDAYLSSEQVFLYSVRSLSNLFCEVVLNFVDIKRCLKYC